MLALTALTGILISVVLFDASTTFPRTAALLPSLGAALLIHSGSGGANLVNRMLSTRSFILIGLLSYSIYLWHWPLLVLIEYYLIRPLKSIEIVVIIATSIFIAFLSWRYIERPIRQTRTPRLSRVTAWRLAAVCMTAASAAGIGLHQSGGLPIRFPSAIETFATARADREANESACNPWEGHGIDASLGNACVIGAAEAGDPSFIIWVTHMHDSMSRPSTITPSKKIWLARWLQWVTALHYKG